MQGDSHIMTLSNVRQVSQRISKLCGSNEKEIYCFLLSKIKQNS